MAHIKEPVDRKNPAPAEPPPPEPRDQPDGIGEPDEPDVPGVNENGDDPINPPVDEPVRDGND